MSGITVGSVTIDADGQATGSGLSLTIFQAEAAARADLFEALPGLGYPDAVPPESDRLWATSAALKAARLAQVIYDAIAEGI